MYLSNKKIVLWLYLSVVIFSSCKNKILPDDSIQPVKVSVFEIKKEKYSDSLNSFGTTTYNLKNNITCLQEGQIIYFPYHDGDFVNKGQLIAKLKNIQLEFQKEDCENNLRSALTNLEMAKNSYREKVLECESQMLNIQKKEMYILQSEQEIKLQEESVSNKKELHRIGGVTTSNLKQIQTSLETMKIDLEIQKKDLEILKLGYRDEDLINEGFEIPVDYETKKRIIHSN